MQNTTLSLPRLTRGVDRDGNAPSSTVDGGGVDPATVDCRKLRGPARDMCYQAMSLAQAQQALHAAQPSANVLF